MLPSTDHARSSQQQHEKQRFSSSTPDLYDINGRVLVSQPLDAGSNKRRISVVDTPAKGAIAYQKQHHQFVSQTPTPDPFDHAGSRPDGGRPPLGHTSGNAQQQHHHYHHRPRSEASLSGHDLTTVCFNGTAESPASWVPIPETLASHGSALGPSPMLSAASSFSTRSSVQSLQLHRPQPLRHQQDAADSERQQASLHSAVPPSLGVEINPIYEWPAFLEYRRKQSEKGPDDRMGQKWPIERELAFIDALLLIAPIGRRKYQMSSQQDGGGGGGGCNEQYGRNMLISEYLWINCFLQHLAAGIPEPLREWKEEKDESGNLHRDKNGKPKPKVRHHEHYSPRKMVSSHLQVIKAFFKLHPSLYTLFPTQERIRDGDEPEGILSENLKADPVLLALREKRMPEERPNYAYWSWVLAADQRVHLRPSQCWICVSARTVRYVPDEVRGGGYAYNTATGERLDQAQFPHLNKNLRRDEWPRAATGVTGPLLHEYTQAIKQEPGGSAHAMKRDWAHDFPLLHKPLDQALRENVNDIFHCHVVLDVHGGDLPAGSELNSWVEVTIQQPGLHNHDWKVRTLLSRPPELCQDGVAGAEDDPASDKAFTEVVNSSGHVLNCKLAGTCSCDCVRSRQRPEIDVNPPAHELAIMLKELSRYPAHAFTGLVDDSGEGVVRGSSEWMKQEKESDAKKKKKKGKRPSVGNNRQSAGGAGKRAEDCGEDDATVDDDDDSTTENKFRKYMPDGPDKDTPTQIALAKRVAMMQELWSQEQPRHGAAGGQPGPWVRRGVILWTFATAYQVKEESSKLVIAKQDGATSWRFLTPIDPYSAEHRSRAILTGEQVVARAAAATAAAAEDDGLTPVHGLGAPAVHRSQVMSPDPGFQQHMSASMSENFAVATAWPDGDASADLAMAGQQQQQQQQQHGPAYARHSYHHQQRRPQQHHRPPRHTVPSYYGPVLGDMTGVGGGNVAPVAQMPPSSLAQLTGSGMAPNLSFLSTSSAADSVDSAVDPFLSSSLGGYGVVAPDGWEAHGMAEMDGASASSHWSIHGGSGVFGAGGGAAVVGSHPLPWDAHPQHQNQRYHHAAQQLQQQQQQHGPQRRSHHRQGNHHGSPGVWGVPTAASTPTSSAGLDMTATTTAAAAAGPAGQLQHHHQHAAWTAQVMSAASSLASSPCPTPASSHRDDGGGGGRGANRTSRPLKRARQDDDDGDAHGLYAALEPRLGYPRLEGYASVADAKYVEEHEEEDPPVWLKNE
ncbi:hypothetical protein RB595_005601 [Gaeumannomyces hyphopodioides]